MKSLFSKLWIFAVWSALALLATTESKAQQLPEPPPMSSEFKVALENCASQGIAVPTPGGQPPSAEFDACMTAQGFKRPDHLPDSQDVN